MSNKRIYWAITALGVAAPKVDSAPTSPTAATFVPGVQSVGISTTFNLEQVFELGQLEIYHDVEDVPDVEITVERVIDSFMCLYQRVMGQATDGGTDRKAAGTVIKIPDCQNNRCDVYFEIHPDHKEAIGDTTAPSQCWIWCSGMYCSSASFNFSTDGNFTESITLVGNHKKWYTANATFMTGAPTITTAATTGIDSTQNTDAVEVKRRHNFYLAEVPAEIQGGGTTVVNSLSISTDFGREQINTLGQRLPYHRYVTFPVEVTCDIEVTVTDAIGQDVDADPAKNNVGTGSSIKAIVTKGVDPTDIDTKGSATDLHTFDLGDNNKLTSISYGGGDSGGANATYSYSYRNFNKLEYTFKSGEKLHGVRS